MYRFISISVLLSIIFFGCISSDPAIKQAESECGDIGSMECYLTIAIANDDPSICLLANAAVDDMCIQDYYQAKNSTFSCEQIKTIKPGHYENCIEYYANK